MAESTPAAFADAKEEPSTFVSDVRAAFTAYHDCTRQWRLEAHTDGLMNKGGEGQWDAADVAFLKSQSRPVQAFNITAPIVNFVAGYQWQQDVDYRAYPRGSEDEQVGRIITATMKHVMDVTSGKLVQHQQFRRGIVSGLSILEVGHTFEFVDDMVEGEISLNVIPELAWYCEVGARRYDRNDAAYQGKPMWFLTGDACERWADKSGAFTSGSNGVNSAWTGQDPRLTGVPEHLYHEFVDAKTGRVRVLQHWYRKPITIHLLVNNQTGEVQTFTTGKEAEAAIRAVRDEAGQQAASVYHHAESQTESALINKQTGQIHAFASPELAGQALSLAVAQAGQRAASIFETIHRPTTAMRVAHLTGWELLDDKPSPYGSDWRYPFVPFIACQDSDDYGSVKGLVRDIRDPQREVNWHHATMLDTLVRGPKGGVWIPKGEHTDLEKIRRRIAQPGFVGEFIGNQPPVPVIPQTLGGADQSMLQFSVEMASRISSVSAELVGQGTQKTVSGRAIGLRQQGGLVGLASLMANWEETKRLAGELIVRRIQQFYSPEKMQQILGDGQAFAKQVGLWGTQIQADALAYEQFVKVKNVDVDIVVDFQETSPTARNAVSQQMLQFKAMGAPIPMQLIIEASDIPYKQEILANLQKEGEQPPNQALIQALGSGQGMSGPNGVNNT